MSWEEAQEAFKRTDVAIVPIGSMETHGRHNPLGTDTFAAAEVARRTGEKSGAIVIPIIPIGYSIYHGDFPGCLSLEKETIHQILMQVCRQLNRYGINRVVLLSGHGGNLSILETVAYDVYQEMNMLPAIPVWWRDEILGALDPKLAFSDHGGMKETSQNLAIVPNLVDLKRYRPSKFGMERKLTENLTLLKSSIFIFKGINIRTFLNTGDVWPEGFWDTVDHPANKATAEIGEVIFSKVSDFLAEFIADFAQVPLPLEHLYPEK